jgi:hypothetical protein
MRPGWLGSQHSIHLHAEVACHKQQIRIKDRQTLGIEANMIHTPVDTGVVLFAMQFVSASALCCPVHLKDQSEPVAPSHRKRQKNIGMMMLQPRTKGKDP